MWHSVRAGTCGHIRFRRAAEQCGLRWLRAGLSDRPSASAALNARGRLGRDSIGAPCVGKISSGRLRLDAAGKTG